MSLLFKKLQKISSKNQALLGFLKLGTSNLRQPKSLATLAFISIYVENSN